METEFDYSSSLTVLLMSDIHSLGIQGSILTPLSPSYETANQRYSPTAILKPSYIVVPATADDVVLALRFARSQNPPSN
ncbi:hypothetical protein VKT23_017570 [Stygiomarasmius scandens]|uniref:Uncharacterized protein n=1 Tax=Marasmiellus scandens TaxID=2682957 RepID=A0ABR1IUY9_9AGAR